MLKKILIAVGVLVLLVVVSSFFLPRVAHVERKGFVHGTPATVFDLVNTLSNWKAWSWWHTLDSNTQYAYSDVKYGKDAWYSWASESENVGKGKLTITGSFPNDSILGLLEFEGMRASQLKYRFAPVDEGTEVSLILEADNGFNPIGRWFAFLFMDKMLGADFEKNLHGMDSLASLLPKRDIVRATLPVTPALLYTIECKPNDVSDALGKAYGAIQETASKQNLKLSGAPFCIYHKHSPESVVMTAGLGLESGSTYSDPWNQDKMNIVGFRQFPITDVIQSVHYGSYNMLGETHGEIQKYWEVMGIQVTDAPWEIYITDPMTEADINNWQTIVAYPVK